MALDSFKERFLLRYSHNSSITQEKTYFLFWAQISFVLLGTLIILFFIYAVLNLGSRNYSALVALIIVMFFGLITSFLTWKGRYGLSRRIFSFAMFAMFSFILIKVIAETSPHITSRYTMEMNILNFFYYSITFFLLFILIAIFNSRRSLIISSFIPLVGSLVFYKLVPQIDSIPINRIIDRIVALNVMIMMAVALLYIYSLINDKTFKTAEQELAKNKELNTNLEQKVIERTQRIKSIESSLKKYLPKQLVETITKGEQVAEPKTERRKLTVFSSDIKGFTDLTESMEAEDMSKLLNEYLTEMTSIANKHGGTLDKFIGDAVMIFFGAPETKSDHENALNCVKMAIEMQERMKDLQEKWFNDGIENPLEIRIGISTGTATVGNFGAEDRLSYTVIGGQVNIASRLESICEPNSILISHPTWALVKDQIECLPREKVQVKGIHREIITYDVVMG